MQGQQDLKLYTKRTQGQINPKDLIHLDPKKFIAYVESQLDISKRIILDTNMFLPFSMSSLPEYIINNGFDARENIKEIFSKANNYLDILSLSLRYCKGFVATEEVIDEINEWNFYWKNLINRKSFLNDSPKMRYKHNGLENFINKNFNLSYLLKQESKEYISKIILIRNFLENEGRVLKTKNQNHNSNFKFTLREILETTKRSSEKISRQDMLLVYNLFISSLDYSTGLISRDGDIYGLVKSVDENKQEINKRLNHHDLHISHNFYNRNFFIEVVHVCKT